MHGSIINYSFVKNDHLECKLLAMQMAFGKRILTFCLYRIGEMKIIKEPLRAPRFGGEKSSQNA